MKSNKFFMSVSVILSLVMLVLSANILSVSAYEDAEPGKMNIAIDGGTEQLCAKAGETVEVVVRLINNPGISSLKAVVSWDSHLILQSAVYNIYNPKDRSAMINEPEEYDDDGEVIWTGVGNSFIFNWISAKTESTSDKYVTLTFVVDETTKPNQMLEVKARISPDDVFNKSETNVDFELINGGVYVIDRDPIDIVIDGADEAVEAAAGKLVKIGVTLLHDVEISSLRALISWDEKLELVNAEYDIYNPKDTSSLVYEPEEYDDDFNPLWSTVTNPFPFNWLSAKRVVTGETVPYLTLTFRVSEDAEPGEFLPVTAEINQEDVFVGVGREIPFNLYNGGVTVIRVIPGDVDRDETVCNKDVAALSRYLNGEEMVVKGDEDVNEDEAVDALDLEDLFAMVCEFGDDDVIAPVVSKTEDREFAALSGNEALKIVIDGAFEANKYKNGETVEVKVNLVDNPGISSLKTVVSWPAELELVDAVYNIYDEEDADSFINVPADGWDAVEGAFAFNWISADNTVEGDVTFVTLTFKVSDEAEKGAFLPVCATAKQENVFAGKNTEIPFEIYNGGVDVKSFDIGDVNRDGIVNNKDVVALFKYINNAITADEIELDAADINGDGTINNKDVVALFKIVSGAK